jgi:hypothetical protein
VADFSSLNSAEIGGQVNGRMTNGTNDVNSNFADFENNKIFNAAGEKMNKKP